MRGEMVHYSPRNLEGMTVNVRSSLPHMQHGAPRRSMAHGVIPAKHAGPGWGLVEQRQAWLERFLGFLRHTQGTDGAGKS